MIGRNWNTAKLLYDVRCKYNIQMNATVRNTLNKDDRLLIPTGRNEVFHQRKETKKDKKQTFTISTITKSE